MAAEFSEPVYLFRHHCFLGAHVRGTLDFVKLEIMGWFGTGLGLHLGRFYII